MWWKPKGQHFERAPRYQVSLTASAWQEGRVSFVTVKNISTGGVLITLPRDSHFLEDLPTRVKVTFRGTTIEFHGKLAYYRIAGEEQLFGIQFGALPASVRSTLESWLDYLKETNTPTSKETGAPLVARLKNLIATLIHKGHRHAPEEKTPPSQRKSA